MEETTNMGLVNHPEHPSRIGVIESLFRQYPDVPPELVIKQDLLSLGQRFSDSALNAAAGAEAKSYRLFSYDLMPMASMPRQEYLKVPEHFIIKGGPYSLRPVQIQTTIASDSPYLVDVVEGNLRLCLDGKAIADAGYLRPMKYYSRSFPDGTAYRDVIAFGSFVTIFRFCQFWGVRRECKFCDINENARQMLKQKSHTLKAPVKTVEQISEVADEIGREVLTREGYAAPVQFVLTGGAITTQLQGLNEDDFYLRYVEAVKWGGPRRYVILQTLAKDKETMRRYRSAGVDCVNANMEVWDKRLFEWICPGKNKSVGRDEWVKRIVDSVDVFGEGNVRPNFVCGVEMARPHGFKTVAEAVKSTTEGIGFLMSHGVMPRCNQWRREPKAYLQKTHHQPPVPPEFYLQLMRNYYENWKRYQLPLPPLWNNRAHTRVIGVSHGLYEDYPILMEERNYGNLALQALEKSGVIWNYNP